LPPGINRVISTHKRKEITLFEKLGNPESIEEYIEVNPNKQYLSNTDLHFDYEDLALQEEEESKNPK